MTECYFMPTPGEFYPEDPPEEKEEITRQSWSDPEWAKEHGLPPGYHEERGLVPFPKVDFEMLAHTYMLQDEKDFSVDYQVYQRRADGTLYLRRSRYQG